jgi:phosphocarrier protein HPr
MILEKVVIRNELGLHARPAAEFVKAASKFKCTVQLAKDDEEWVNGKSVLGILTLAVEQGDSLLLRIDGKGDAEEEQRAREVLAGILQGS